MNSKIKTESINEKCDIFLALPNIHCEKSNSDTDIRVSYSFNSAIWISAPSEKIAREIIQAYELHKLNDSSHNNDILNVTKYFNDLDCYNNSQQKENWIDYFQDNAEIGRILWNGERNSDMFITILPIQNSLHLKIIESTINIQVFRNIVNRIVEDYSIYIFSSIMDAIVNHTHTITHNPPPNYDNPDEFDDNIPF